MTKRFGVPQARQDRSNALTAFTLAEVLITLGIIGVVAAMTIPTLISNTNGAQFKTAYKKALSTLNQAVLMNIAMEDTDFSTLKKEETTGDGATATVSLGGDGTMSSLLTSRMQSATPLTYPTGTVLSIGTTGEGNTPVGVEVRYTGACDPATQKLVGGGDLPEGATCNEDGTVELTAAMETSLASYVPYSFADGTAFMYHKEALECTDSDAVENKCYGFIDVNGVTGPNSIIKCTKGTEGGTGTDACEVEASGITDMFPVIFHGQTVEPATDAARAVLFGK